MADVLDADVDAFLDVAVADLLVEDDADGGLCNVVYDASLAVVYFEGLFGWFLVNILSQVAKDCVVQKYRL